MKRQFCRYAAAGVAVMLGGPALVGCSSNTPAASPTASAVSAARSAASALASTASTAAASAVASAVASAQAVASSALANVKGGLEAKTDVTPGTAMTASDGRAEVPLTVTNHGSKSGQYTIQVNFKQSGSVVDVVVVNVPEVAAGGTAHATARSNRKLSGAVTAEVPAALRY